MLIIAVTMLLLFGHASVLRYPSLSLDPKPRPNSIALALNGHITARGAYVKQAETQLFRAYSPAVSLRLNVRSDQAFLQLAVENIHPQATLKYSGVSGKLVEQRDGLLRRLEFRDLTEGQTIQLDWVFPKKPHYRFAAMGDTGGGSELEWGLIRAHQLGADFVLHLGDAYYVSSEVGQVGTRMNASKIPVYTANGNHDFRGPNGNSVETFLKNIGPLNARFNLLGHCFINLDTGAYMFPPHQGQRAKYLAASIVDAEACNDTIVFTHKPLIAEIPKDDRLGLSHSLNGYDAKPLLQLLGNLKQVTIIAGHIHADFEFEETGIKTYVTGSGLAQSDLVEAKPRAQILLGELYPNRLLETSWAANNMPMAFHCSNKIYQALQRDDKAKAREMKQACRSSP